MTEASRVKSKLMSNFRWRIAGWFVVLSSVVYLSLTCGGVLFFFERINSSLDAQLEVLLSELGHAVNVQGGRPVFRDWARIVRTEPASSLASIQIFDANGKRLESYGPNVIDFLAGSKKEVATGDMRWRLRSTPLIHGGRMIGYLQIAIPIRVRDDAIRTLVLMVMIIAPLVVIGLGVCAYLVSGKAASPIEANMRLMRRFVEDAGHELNTPLAIIQARLDAMEKKLQRQGAVDAINDLPHIESSVSRMTAIVRDLMLLAEMDGFDSRLSLSLVHAQELAENIRDEFQARMDEKNLEFSVSAEDIAFAAREDMIFRLLMNLTENAIRYTNAGGKVSVSILAEDTEILFVVADNGIGIPEESLANVFERFYRVDPSRSRNLGGTGLGLSIVKAIAEAHSGRVAITSHVGVGTTVTVAIPGSNKSAAETVSTLYENID